MTNIDLREVRTALITGASSGIGLATAKRLVTSGVDVIGVARDFSKTDFDAMVGIKLDLSETGDLPDRLVESDLFNRAPDLLVLNAGYGRFGGLEQFSHQQIRHLVDTNLVSNLILLKHFLPKMKACGVGDIVLIGSESALHGARGGAVYCATKFAIRGLAQSLRADCSTSNIRVILVNPGPVDTEFFDELSFAPQTGDEFVIEADAVAQAIMDALKQPRNCVTEEINLQPMKRSFQKKNRAGS